MDLKNILFWVNFGGELCWLAPNNPPTRCLLMAFRSPPGDYASYNDCGVVNGITADAFIVPCFFQNKNKTLLKKKAKTLDEPDEGLVVTKTTSYY